MANRRSFLEKLGKGAAFSTLALSLPSPLFSQLKSRKKSVMKTKIIGIIGAENSHSRGFGKMFNLDKKFPGWEVKYIWGEKEEFAQLAKDEAGIPVIVKEPSEMMGKIDALIVDHRHGDLHLDAALPFVQAGIPTFIDKPFCYSSKAAKIFLEMAKEVGTPVTSYSSIAHSNATVDMRKQLAEMKEINQVTCYGKADINSIYGGFFFYGVHMVEPLIYLFDEKIVSARFNKNEKENLNSTASLIFENGRMATLVITSKKYGWQTFVETDEGVVELKSRVETVGPDKNYVDMVTMFSTGKEPRSHESIIHGIAILEALQKSIISGNWESVVA
ncbi:Gfo/Idh/MocA family oxidoreductase [Arenibacter sp. BSSL-BM3]|uniref:Gfo/Idh/MocA family oxidoreductase n=1 Tax=Arenibacter arenosicollis TaxID=2762274 RepID=A0ABR7QPS6_9FLAO|nr:Gfo/Idh/MocA family oxidoreductase [Arenibacter arenosicollis]MBC8769203.1 Gfo/Idh/MocA family oxidoreductase [Arenibacter arenosicollis]